MNGALTLSAALLLGFAASGHCVVMCGGISAALGMSLSSLGVILNALRIGRSMPAKTQTAPTSVTTSTHEAVA